MLCVVDIGTVMTHSHFICPNKMRVGGHAAIGLAASSGRITLEGRMGLKGAHSQRHRSPKPARHGAGLAPPGVVLTGGVRGLADRHPQGGRIERLLGNEYRTATCRGFDGASQGLAVTDQLVEISSATRDLGDPPVADGGAHGRHIQLVEEVSERGIRGRPPGLKPSASVNTLWRRMAKRSRSRKLWQPLRIPSTATSSKYQAGNQTPRRVRASGIDLR